MNAAASSTLPRLVDAALAYTAGRGWPVFPCAPRSKRPLTPNGVKDATVDAAVIARWWSHWQTANLAIATGRTSGLVVLDVDPRNGGTESLARLQADYGNLPETARAVTGGGGTHYLFAHPGECEVRCRSGLPGYPGLDLKGDGGYIVGPPSIHPSGRQYVWQATPESVSLAPCPSWLIDLAGRIGNCAAEHRESTERELIDVGARNDSLTSVAGSMRRLGMEPEEILAALRAVNRRRCKPPLDDTEVEKIARSIGRYPPGHDEPFRAYGAYRAPLADGDWPAPLAPAAFHGLAGEFVRLVQPHTEADPAALLIHFLVMFASVVGRARFFRVGRAHHYPNLFAVVVGESAKARKGTAREETLPHVVAIDPTWNERVQSGLSSGEGLIWAVRDSSAKQGSKKTDPGVADKRLLVIESEFASVLRMIGREGNVLSAVIRDAWDHGDLRVLTRGSPAKATASHICVIGHITFEELRAELTRTDAASGFGNRFLWTCAKRWQLLPEGGCLHEGDLAYVREALSAALAFACTPGEIKRDEAARVRWHEIYAELSEGQPGLFGAVTSRAEAQVVRLALVYALLDCSDTIQLRHLEAALAVWRYCEASAASIFGNALGDPIADEILRALTAAGDTGMTRDEIRNLFQRHRSSAATGRALDLLKRCGRAFPRREETGGRPAVRWFAAARDSAKSAKSAESPK